MKNTALFVLAMLSVPVLLAAGTQIAELISAPSSVANFAGVAGLAVVVVIVVIVGKILTGNLIISFRSQGKGESS